MKRTSMGFILLVVAGLLRSSRRGPRLPPPSRRGPRGGRSGGGADGTAASTAGAAVGETVSGSVLMRFLELEAAFARGVGERFYFAVVKRAGAVENHRAETGGLGLGREGEA